jgi:hypothetical protein
LRDYPVYLPPSRNSQFFYSADKQLGGLKFLDPKTKWSKSQIKANYDYFLEQKAARLDHLAKYLANFSITLRPTRETLLALDQWLFRYGVHLVPNSRHWLLPSKGGDLIYSLAYYNPAWTGVYRGLNVINDIAIFAGDYIVSKNKNVHWDAWYGEKRKDYEVEGFGQPCLFGVHHFIYESPYSTFRALAHLCMRERDRIEHGHRHIEYKENSVTMQWASRGDFVRWLDYLSDPDPVPPRALSQILIDHIPPPRKRGRVTAPSATSRKP